MKEKTLAVYKRDEFKKGASRRLRKEGKIPAIIYGARKPLPVAIEEKEFESKFHSVSENTIINLNVGKDKYSVLVKDYQEDVLLGKIIHIDFFEVEEGKKLKTNIPIHITGVAPGVTLGGFLVQRLHEMEVECLPKDIPEEILVDISELNMGNSIHVEEVSAIEGVKFLNISNQVVVMIAAPKAEEVEEEEIEDVEEGEEVLAEGETPEPEGE